LKKKALIHIGASELQFKSLRWAKEVGLYIVATDLNRNALGRKYADEFHNISGIDSDAFMGLVRQLKKTHDIVGAYCNSDFGVRVVSEINELLGISGCVPSSVDIALDKSKAKTMMSASNIPVPQGIIVDRNSFYDNTLQRLKLPVIVKPTDSCGSQGVMYVDNAINLTRAILNAFQYSKKVMIEEFCDGIGVDTIGIMIDGNFYPYGIGARIFSELPYRYPIHGYTPSGLNDSEEKIAYQITENASRLLGLNNGPVKADLIYHQGSFHLLEVTPRFHGEVFTSNLIYYSTGVSPIKDLFFLMKNGRLPSRDIGSKKSQIILWKALFPKSNSADLRGIMGKMKMNNIILDFLMDERIPRKLSSHKDNTTVGGFFWAAFKEMECMHKFILRFDDELRNI
jgi:biotin carboxylase